MERSFKKEVQALKLGDGETFRGEGILAVTKALAAVGRELCRRLSGLAGLAPDRRSGRCRGHHRRPRRASGDLHQRGCGGRDAGRLDQLSAARRGDLEVDRRHQRGGRRAVQPRLPGRDRRRDDHPGRGLRRRRKRDPGALLCLRHEVLDLAARPAPGPADHRAHGRAGLRALGGEPRAGDDGAARARLSRHRRVHRQGEPARRLFGQEPHRRSTRLRLWQARASAGHLLAGAAQGRGAAAGGAAIHPRPQAQRADRRRPRRDRPDRGRRPHHRRVACARAARPRRSLWGEPHSDLRAQRRLSAGARRVARVLRR